ncbi:HPP family protein [Purpureocillium lavendulum]|uniref:HPP family protein n=1 Tax=Purpureocillium lavendulum TaxID=1247861 RepID=A0AB34G1E0_9HYPO|nr:HPP family protein [Purpureocillium lavendulum]
MAGARFAFVPQIAAATPDTMGYRTWNFDIDRYLNPLVPAPPWRYLPYPVAHWFGYRKAKQRESGNLMPIFWAFIGIFCAILIIEAVSRHVPSFESKGVPMIVGSFGAAAVLEFYSIEAPLAQPRNAIVGQLIAAVVGVGVGKLFQLSDKFGDIQFVGGALACASATALMALTKTVHPPAGATALLAVVDSNLIRIGWFLIPVMLLGCALMLGVALLINNVERRFPMYWWTPEDLRQSKPAFVRRKSDEEMNVAAGAEKETVAGDASHRTAVSDGEGDGSSTQQDQEDSDGNGGVMFKRVPRAHEHAGEVVIKPGQVIVPEHMFLTQEEEQLLETMSYRL